MKSLLRPLVSLALAPMLGGLFASGCVDNKSTLFIIGVEQLEPPECEIKAEATASMLLGGVMDVSLVTSYTAGLLVGNQYTPRGDKENLRAETTRVNLRGAEIELRDSGGKLLPSAGADCDSEFSVNGTGFVNPNKGADAGFGVFAARVIPECMGYALASQIGTDRTLTREIVASVRVFGETTGGQDITSGELTFPITICYGCLISYPSDALNFDPDAAQQTTCDKNTDQAPEPGCFLGQDRTVDCRLCNNRPACISPTL